MINDNLFDPLAHKILSLRASQNDEMISLESTHAKQSRAWMLKGVDYCKQRRRAVIMAPGILEPISELSVHFSEIILLGHDVNWLMELAAHLKNVTIMQYDLTGGIFYKISQECTHAAQKKTNTTELLTSLLTVLKNDSKSVGTGFPFKEIDYIISSNVLSQLPLHAFDFIMQQATAHSSACSKSNAEIPQPKVQEFQEVFSKWKTHVYERYINYLHRLQGIVYLSDTSYKVKLGTQNQDAKKERSQKIEGWSAVQKQIKHQFTECASATWTWDTIPFDTVKLKNYEGFEVQMQLLSPK